MLPTAASIFEKLPRFLRRHRLMIIWMKLTGEPTLQLVRIRNRSFGYADMSDGFLRLIVIDQGFESGFFALADRLFAQGGTFLDVGANHGLLSFGLAGRHGSCVDFHLFEPNLKLLDSIEKTRPLYPQMRLTLNAQAVSDTDGTVSFEINENQTGTSHIGNDEAATQVPCVTLDTYVKLHELTRIDLLKLDIEGYELLALRGARDSLEARVIRAVYFEYFEKWLQRVAPPAHLLTFLDDAGYAVCFCHSRDINPRGGATHEFQGISVLPVDVHNMPPMTDLLAVPKEALKLAR